MTRDTPGSSSHQPNDAEPGQQIERLLVELREGEKQGWVHFVGRREFVTRIAAFDADKSTRLILDAKSVRFQRVVPHNQRQPKAGARATRIRRPPGTHLARGAAFLLTKEAYRRYVYPVIADLQHEYIEAVVAGEELRARWIAVRGWLQVIPGWLVAFAGGLVGWVVKKMLSS